MKYRATVLMLYKSSSIQVNTVICIPIVCLRRLFRIASSDNEAIICSLLSDLQVYAKLFIFIPITTLHIRRKFYICIPCIT